MRSSRRPLDERAGVARHADRLCVSPDHELRTAEQFYGQILGLECSKRYDNELGGEFETGSLTIQLVDVAKIGRPFEASTGAIALHVDDVEAARSELRSRGVVFHHHRYAPPGARPAS